MKLFIDDLRPAPDGWIVARHPYGAILLIDMFWDEITDISFDHDLGFENVNLTGYGVILWMEEEVRDGRSVSHMQFNVHSMNPVGNKKIWETIKSIRNYESFDTFFPET